MDMSTSSNEWRRPTPIHLASFDGDLTTLQNYITEDKRNASGRDAFDGTPLHYAVRGRQTACVSALLAAPIDVNALDSTGYAPLHYACAGRWDAEDNEAFAFDVITLLIQKGHADVNLRTPEKATPLIVALREGNAVAASTLLSFHSSTDLDLTAADQSGLTALHHAALGHEFKDRGDTLTAVIGLMLSLGKIPSTVTESALAAAEKAKGPNYYAVRDVLNGYIE